MPHPSTCFLSTTPCENQLFVADGRIMARKGSHNVKKRAEIFTLREMYPGKAHHLGEIEKASGSLHKGTKKHIGGFNLLFSSTQTVKIIYPHRRYRMLFFAYFIRKSSIKLVILQLKKTKYKCIKCHTM